MDQRTRERMPVLPVLGAPSTVNAMRPRRRLETARTAQPGEPFTTDGVTLQRARSVQGHRHASGPMTRPPGSDAT